MIVNAGTLLSFFDRDDPAHWAVTGTIELLSGSEQLVISPFVVAELEPIVRDRYGPEGWLAVLDELAGGAWAIATIDSEHLAAMRERVAAGASLAAASLDVLAEREAS